MIWDLEKLVLREITLTETMHNQGFLAYILILLANYLDMLVLSYFLDLYSDSTLSL